MNLHNSDGPPCRHMENMLKSTADGTAGTVAKWYATSHAKGCTRCQCFLNEQVAKQEETVEVASTK